MTKEQQVPKKDTRSNEERQKESIRKAVVN